MVSIHMSAASKNQQDIAKEPKCALHAPYMIVCLTYMCLTCVPYMCALHAPYICLTCVPYMCALHVPYIRLTCASLGCALKILKPFCYILVDAGAAENALHAGCQERKNDIRHTGNM